MLMDTRSFFISVYIIYMMQSDFAVERRENSPPLHRKERPETCKISLVLRPFVEARDFQHIEIIIHVQV